MRVELRMPRLSDSMERGTILRWLKSVGEPIATGEPIAEIETDKATVEYSADVDGVLLEILIAEGATADLGSVIAVVGEPSDVSSGRGPETPAFAAATDAPVAVDTPVALTNPQGQRVTGKTVSERTKATPLARRLAADLGVNLRSVVGTGPNGRITKRNVLNAAPGATQTRAAPPEPPPVQTGNGAAVSELAKGASSLTPLSSVQRTVARRMAESKATIPDFTLFADVDMTGCVALRDQLRTLDEHPPSYNDMIVKAAALALAQHPRANASYRDGAVELHARINIGIAVATDDTLIVPTLVDADRLSLRDLAAETRRLAAAVRERRVTPAELAGATFTVSNLGMYGVSAFTAIVNPPQAAILSAGMIEKRAVVTGDGVVASRDMATLGLACDHRILDGAQAARFLARIRSILQQPLSLAF